MLTAERIIADMRRLATLRRTPGISDLRTAELLENMAAIYADGGLLTTEPDNAAE